MGCRARGSQRLPKEVQLKSQSLGVNWKTECCVHLSIRLPRARPAAVRDLQMGVAMEASSTSHFLAEFICEFPVLVPVPSCKHRRGRVVFSCLKGGCGESPACKPPTRVSCRTCHVTVSHPSMLPLSVSSQDVANEPQPLLGAHSSPAVSDGDMSSRELPLTPSSWRSQRQSLHSDPPPR